MMGNPVGRLRVGFYALAVALAGCGALQSQTTQPLPTAMSDAGARDGDLLYVSVGNTVREYSLPQAELKQTLTGLSTPEGLCSDAVGNVFIPNLGTKQILEYAHGGASPIQTLKARGYPYDCAVDPTTGDLAVVDIDGPHGVRGNIAVYKNASGSPKIYNVRGWRYATSCAYDREGNLVAIGFTQSFFTKIAELLKGESSFNEVTLNRHTTSVYWIQSFGGAFTVYAAPLAGIYRLRISGSKGVLDGPAPLRKASRISEYAFSKRELVGIVYDFPPKKGVVRFWPYPVGGEPAKTIPNLRNPDGITVSLEPR